VCRALADLSASSIGDLTTHRIDSCPRGDPFGVVNENVILERDDWQASIV